MDPNTTQPVQQPVQTVNNLQPQAQQSVTPVPPPPPPPVQTQPIPQPPNPKPSAFPSLIILFLLICFIVAGVFLSQKYLLPANNQKQSPAPEATAASTATPDPTANWKTYTGETIYSTDKSTMFSIKYPQDWMLEKNVLYPFGKQIDKRLETRISLGVGGRGWPEAKVETKTYPAGEATYSWINSGTTISAFATFISLKPKEVSYIFEIQNLPAENDQTYRAIFDQMLTTFKYVSQLDETTNWKEYKVEETGLIFKAPVAYNVQTQADSVNQATITTTQSYPFNAPPPDNPVKIVVTFDPNDTSTLITQRKELTLPASFTIAGFEAIKGTKIVKGINLYEMYFLKNGKIVSIINSPATKDSKSITDQIISTFKF